MAKMEYRTKVCPKCNAMIASEKFCPECGYKLVTNATPASQGQNVQQQPAAPEAQQPSPPVQPVQYQHRGGLSEKKNILLLISAIIGSLYLCYIIFYFFNGIATSADAMEAVGTGIATALVLPHMVVLLVAVVFNCIGWVTSKPWAALVGGILYSVSALLFILYALFVVIEVVLSFVGYAKLRRS